jgi:nucleoid-associated protein YgaU
MPNDAKLGLIVGVAMVVGVAAMFFRKDHPEQATASAAMRSTRDDRPAVAANRPAAPAATPPRTPPTRSVKARPVSRSDSPGVEHVVREGDTLFGLAQRYYGDGDRFIDIYLRNRDQLSTPDRLVPGSILIIPDLAAGEAP